MVGQNRRVQHVGIGQHQIGLGLDPPALGGWRVAVVDSGLDGSGHLAIFGKQFQQPFELILGQRLGGKQIQRSSLFIPQTRLQNGQVVTQRLATRGAGHDDEVLMLSRQFNRGRLVTIQRLDPACAQHSPNVAR